MLTLDTGQRTQFILDVGGEGRHPEAWNLNPSRLRTLGKKRGQPIPQHMAGRADSIPVFDGSVDQLIVERTPLQVVALHEIGRVIASHGTIILRHAQSPLGDPHAVAKRIFPGPTSQRVVRLGGQIVQETVFYSSSFVGER